MAGRGGSSGYHQLEQQGTTESSPGGGEEHDKQKPEGEPCFPIGEVSIYTAVLVAAFGGVRVKVGTREVKVHSMVIFLLSIPLFVVQLSSLFALRLDMDIVHPVRQVSADRGDLLLRLKLLMVVVLQLMTFRQLIVYVRMMIFVINPVSWVEVMHPRMDEWTLKDCDWMRPLFHPLLIGPWAFVALIMQALVGYLVCVDSVSIILVSDSVRQAVFNCLSIIFLVELNQLYWQVCEALFNFMPIDGATFFKLDPDAWEEKDPSSSSQCRWTSNTVVVSEDEEGRSPRTHFPAMINWLVLHFPVRRAEKGLANIESFLIFVCLSGIYIRQYFIVIFAVQTNVLPIARDVCTQWRMYTGRTQSAAFRPIVPIIAGLLNVFVVVDLKHHVNDVVQHQLGEKCFMHETYGRMRTSDMWALARKHPIGSTIGVAMIVSLFILPQGVGTMFSGQPQADQKRHGSRPSTRE